MSVQKQRGRPLSNDPYFLQSFLVYCESIRERQLRATGRLLSDRATIRRVSQLGGYRSILAGQTDVIAAEIKNGKLKQRWFAYDANGPTSPPNAQFYVTNHIRDEDYLRKLFVKAKRQLDLEEEVMPDIRAYFGDRVRAQLGLSPTGTVLERPKRKSVLGRFKVPDPS